MLTSISEVINWRLIVRDIGSWRLDDNLDFFISLLLGTSKNRLCHRWMFNPYKNGKMPKFCTFLSCIMGVIWKPPRHETNTLKFNAMWFFFAYIVPRDEGDFWKVKKPYHNEQNNDFFFKLRVEIKWLVLKKKNPVWYRRFDSPEPFIKCSWQLELSGFLNHQAAWRVGKNGPKFSRPITGG
jgi:hypothetical protein